jgi:hypothetical protein
MGVEYKEYSPEESAVYDVAIGQIREGLESGLSFEDACSRADIEDAGLRVFVEDDALKIMLAEQHFAAGTSLPDCAEKLGLSMTRISRAILEMLEDAGISAAEAYQTESESNGPAGNA